jgi:hypothetical protein
MYDLVMHRATVLRMRMANDRAPLQRTLARTLDNGLKTTDRAVNKQSLGHRVLVHY